MVMHVALNHRTIYRYDRLVGLAPQIVRLRPAPHCRTPILSYSLKIEPERAFPQLAAGSVRQLPGPPRVPRADRASCGSRSTSWPRWRRINPFDFFVEPDGRDVPVRLRAGAGEGARPLSRVRAGRAAPAARGWPRSPRRSDADRRFPGRPQPAPAAATSATSSAWSPASRRCEETLGQRSGSCRDSAWLLVQILRHLGFAARFVSGYLIQLKPDVKSLDGPSGAEQDFTDLHAWAEVYLPGAGWIGLDPTSGLLAGEGHIPARLHAGPADRGADHRRRRSLRGRVRLRR